MKTKLLIASLSLMAISAYAQPSAPVGVSLLTNRPGVAREAPASMPQPEMQRGPQSVVSSPLIMNRPGSVQFNRESRDVGATTSGDQGVSGTGGTGGNGGNGGLFIGNGAAPTPDMVATPTPLGARPDKNQKLGEIQGMPNDQQRLVFNGKTTPVDQKNGRMSSEHPSYTVPTGSAYGTAAGKQIQIQIAGKNDLTKAAQQAVQNADQAVRSDLQEAEKIAKSE